MKSSNIVIPNFLSEGVRLGLDKEIRLDGTYLAYFPFSRMIERSRMTPYHKKLEVVSTSNTCIPKTCTEETYRSSSATSTCYYASLTVVDVTATTIDEVETEYW